jgi:hypothetical protein
MSAQVQKRLVSQEKEQRDKKKLRDLANQARMERSGGGMATGMATTTSGRNGNVSDPREDDDDSELQD